MMDTNETPVVSKEKTIEIMKNLEEDKSIFRASEFLKAFSDASRLKILLALANEGLCVNGICEIVGQSQPAVSHHLRQLRSQRIVDFRKEGRNTVYYLDDEHIEDIIRTTFRHIKEK
jgi:ArsR family transcriptional regulator